MSAAQEWGGRDGPGGRRHPTPMTPLKGLGRQLDCRPRNTQPGQFHEGGQQLGVASRLRPRANEKGLGMQPKPNLHLRGISRKGIAAATLAVAGFAGLAVAQTTPAMADPTVQYVATGSDTIQDIINQVGLDEAGNFLGSYNAVNPVTAAAHEVITPVKSTGTLCSFARPNGSGEGVAALRYSVNSGSGATPPTPSPQAGCVDIGRSSSGPGTNASTTGQFIYIPFALDAVAWLVGPATGGVVGGVTSVATSITQANLFTLADLKTMYDSCGTVTEGGVTYWPFQAGITQPTRHTSRSTCTSRSRVRHAQLLGGPA